MKTKPDKKSILLIDPNQTNHILFTAFLEKHYKLLFAQYNTQVHSLLNKQTVNLVFQDLIIDNCAYYTLNEIRKKVPKTPQVVLTTCCAEDEIISCTKLGCTNFLSKPSSKRSIISYVNSLLSVS